MKLRVIQPFNGYGVGDEIANQKEIAAILNSEQAGYVVQVSGDDSPVAKDAPAS